MSKGKIASARLMLSITKGLWAIDTNWVENNQARILRFLSMEDDDTSDDEVKPVALCGIASPTGNSLIYAETFDAAPKGSVAVVELSDAVTKHDYCGIAGTKTLGNLIAQANASPNIDAIVLVMDTPGGSVDGTEVFSNVIKSSAKPVVVYVDGMMCSAGMWIGSAAKHIMASSQTDVVGSIGVMCSFADYSEYYKKAGIKVHTVYADQSKHKNHEYIEALKENYKPMKQDSLNVLADMFIATVKENRGNKITSDEVFTGHTYFTSDAIKLGLVDSVGSLSNAIQLAADLAKTTISTQVLTQTKNEMKIATSFKGILAFVGKAFKAEDTEVELTAEDLTKIEAVIPENETLKTTNATLTSELDAAKAEVATLKSDNLKLVGEKEASTKEVETLTAEVAKLSKTPAVLPAAAANKEGDSEKKNEVFDANASHNIEAEKILGNK